MSPAPGVALRPTNDELPGWIDAELREVAVDSECGVAFFSVRGLQGLRVLRRVYHRPANNDGFGQPPAGVRS